MKEQKERRSGLNSTEAAVRHMVSNAEVAQAEIANKNAGRDGRGRPGNAGEKGRDKTGASKATYALPVARQELIRQMAEEEDVSQTDIVEVAAVILHNLRKAGKIDLEALKVAARSLKVTWHLEIPDDFFLG